MARNESTPQELGPCPICGRSMFAGKSVNEHHLIPKSLKGRETITLHRICHSKIHSILTERELFTHYHTIERLTGHPEMEKFIKWVRKKEPEYVGRNRWTNDRKKRRR